MHRTRPAGGDKGEVSWVVTALNANPLQGM
jgi:hypothetical protein